MPQRRGGLEASCAALKGGTEVSFRFVSRIAAPAVKREGVSVSMTAQCGFELARRLLLISGKNQINIRYLLESLVTKSKINYI